ncbi:hypothetical protein BJ138DRAFT_1170279 [Hygrophoropsis aurantiaca]|uniref:Uncharacterized protein n=1 Tax=Hygrophoropsis aurantiaca TaxID=72124 RepID=A0ACB8AN49_9AGAM|nr:hypothetical protein BJ138DRAFT_1170279 [Hygrophoropsis aurantiaca]
MSSKRKFQGKTNRTIAQPSEESPPAVDYSLYIQAHEADLIRGPQATTVAQSIDVAAYINGTLDRGTGHGLIKWGVPSSAGSFDQSDILPTVTQEQEVLWVDRYDARLLLDSLPIVTAAPAPHRPLSPSGWSDLPSDAEDTFFFSPEEAEDYRRDKRRRVIEKNREERLQALFAAEGGEEPDSDPWGGSDEEPDDNQKELIRRTAIHIMSAGNPAQLEMRILANHGANKKFAFLKGRWSKAWRTAKEKARSEKQAETVTPPTQTEGKVGLGGLADYGDSEGDSDAEQETTEEVVSTIPAPPAASTDSDVTALPTNSDDALKEARRIRAREWAARRRQSHNETPALDT